MLIWLLLLCAQDGATPVEVEDLYSEILHTAITLQDRTFFITLEGWGKGRTNDLYRFDHGSQKLYKLPCEAKLDITCRLIPMETGFALVDRQGGISLFDPNGTFQQQFSLLSMATCPPQFQLYVAENKQEGVILVTYRDLKKVGDLHLAEVDLEAKTFKHLGVRNEDEHYGFWAYFEGVCYFVNAYNAEIRELDSALKTKRVLVPKIEPYLALKEKKYADAIKEFGGSPYLELVRAGATVGDTRYFWRFHEVTKNGLVLHQLALKQGAFKVINSDRMVLAEYPGGSLVFDRDERAFELVPN